ncbi:MAG TPA: fumarylacetoacetase [Steroidobacteraceae bacterium]|jgi:fumarylacetoacetase|nr:fumarylacetoacetase [Steroidobacteraceae bacterium]
MNETHDPLLRSWVESANAAGSDFPIQNLPFGVFRPAGSAQRFRGGVAIGDSIIDLEAARARGAFTATALEAATLGAQSSLNALMAAGPAAAAALRLALSRALRAGSPQRPSLESALVPQSAAELGLPAQIGDYTDFYTSINHATAVGRLFRPDQPLMPNYRWLPIAYHGRCSSIAVSPQAFLRPMGQRLPATGEAPVLDRSHRLDYELELGVFVGRGNALGTRIGIDAAESHVFGLCLLNDWSARDLQAWEYQPLGPFLAKNFATTISPWIVTLEALEPYRVPWTRGADDPQPLAYLEHRSVRDGGAFDIQLEVLLETEAMRGAGSGPVRLSHTSFRHAYWTIAQLLAHHSVNGCNLRSGDLLGTGTQSGPEPSEAGSLLELSRGGKEPVRLENGEQRCFLEDGDAIILRGYCARGGAARIGFGEARGRVMPAQM